MATEGSVANDVGAPESWEVADLDESMSRLMLSTSNKDKHKDSTKSIHDQLAHGSGPGSASVDFGVVQKVDDIVINQVDQFLREALQNPRERLSVLRMEQDIEKFIRDPMQQQMEFQQLPTSYLRLAAHRVAQHYSLQSMVLLDSSLPDGSGSRIIVCKTSECRLPAIRLADIPVNLPSEESGVTKVAIKQRPQKNSTNVNNTNSNSSSSGSKSVEERKEEYSKARARIFNSSNNVSGGASGKLESESRLQDNAQHGSLCISKIEEKFIPNCSNISAGRGIADSSINSRAARTRTEMEPLGRYRPNNRVAIFRDRDVERNDPDYDRSYDRYMQRYDPGFGFNGGPYTIQPMYTPAINYNTEFPQLASTRRPQISAEPQPCPLPQHLPVPWVAQSARAGIGYAHPETIMTQYSPNHVGAHSTSGVYLHSSQYPCQRPGMPFIHPQEHVHHPFLQSHRQPDASFGLARPW